MSLDILLIIFSAAGIFFLITVILSVLQRAYEQYEDRYLAKHITDLSEMFVFVGPSQLVVLTLAVTAIGTSVGLLLFGPVFTIILVSAGLLFPTLLVRFYRIRRIKMFERQLVDALVGTASAFRAGMTLYQTMEEVARTTSPPLSQEFALTVREVRLGKTTEEALENLANRVASDDLALVVTAINTSRSIGGNMAEMLDTISDTIRERFRIEGRIRSLTAQGRLQGLIIGLMPLLVWIGFDMVRPDLTRPMLGHWFGYVMILTVIVMEVLGAFFIRRIVAIKI